MGARTIATRDWIAGETVIDIPNATKLWNKTVIQINRVNWPASGKVLNIAIEQFDGADWSPLVAADYDGSSKIAEPAVLGYVSGSGTKRLSDLRVRINVFQAFRASATLSGD